MRPAILAFAASLFAFAATAHCAETGEPQAQVLAQQLQTWLTGLVGPALPPLQVHPEGDHFRVAIPVPGAPNGAPAAVSAAVRPLAKGRWSIGDIRVPPIVAFSSHSGPGKPPTAYTLTIEDEHAEATLDPAFRTPAKFDFDVNDLDLRAEAPARARAQHTDRLRGSFRLSPAPDDTLTLTEDSRAEGWRFAARSRSGPAVALGADQVDTSARIDGLRGPRIAPLIAAAAGLVAVLPMRAETGNPSDPDAPARSDKDAAKSERPLTPEVRAALGTLIDAMHGVLSSLKATETLVGVKLEIAGLGGATIRRANFGLGGEAPRGVLSAWIDIGLDGLAILGLPQSMAALVPKEIALRPTLSGLPVATLDQLARNAMEIQGTADRSARRQAALEALFATKGFALGIDSLAFALGPARIRGAGSIILVAPDRAEAHARLLATGFDALAEKARTTPELARALPVLIMARGLAKQEGDRLIWDVMRAADGSVSVNGTDLSALRGPAPQSGDNR